MLKKRIKIIEKILFHTIGGGAFKKLSEKCINDKNDWMDLKKCIKEIKKIWKGEIKVEKNIVGALFDFVRLSHKVAKSCDDTIYQEIINITSDLEIDRLFYDIPEESLKPFKGFTNPASNNIEFSEQKCLDCILFHSEGGGAFRQARSHRKFDSDGWDILVTAIKSLKKFWKDNVFVNRSAAAALVNLPLYVDWQANFFEEDDPNSVEVKQFRSIAEELATEIKKLFD